MGFVDNWNSKVATSPVGWWFRLDGSGHVRTSFRSQPSRDTSPSRYSPARRHYHHPLCVLFTRASAQRRQPLRVRAAS